MVVAEVLIWWFRWLLRLLLVVTRVVMLVGKVLLWWFK